MKTLNRSSWLQAAHLRGCRVMAPIKLGVRGSRQRTKRPEPASLSGDLSRHKLSMPREFLPQHSSPEIAQPTHDTTTLLTRIHSNPRPTRHRGKPVGRRSGKDYLAKIAAMLNLKVGSRRSNNMRKTKNQGELSLADRQQGMMQIANASASQLESRDMV